MSEPGGQELTPEAQKQSQTSERKTYLPDQKLTNEEKSFEGQNLIGGFVGIFSKDPDVQSKVIEAYFGYKDSQGRSGLPSGDVFFTRGAGKYWLRTTGGGIMKGQMFRLERQDGHAKELIEIQVGMFEHKPSSIRYSASSDTPVGTMYAASGSQHRHEGKTINAENNGDSVMKGRELLAKVQKDFGKIQPPVSNPPTV